MNPRQPNNYDLQKQSCNQKKISSFEQTFTFWAALKIDSWNYVIELKGKEMWKI